MPNRLADATSPYLQQHADNPVDWWEWSPEALELARTLDRPILLSVGYAACHWCHVSSARPETGNRLLHRVRKSPHTFGLCRNFLCDPVSTG
nr:DUF255 domain-containing protein [Aeromicrobium sp. Root472D3]